MQYMTYTPSLLFPYFLTYRTLLRRDLFDETLQHLLEAPRVEHVAESAVDARPLYSCHSALSRRLEDSINSAGTLVAGPNRIFSSRQ